MDPGNAARNGVGASAAAAGIHEWNGTQPVFPKAPAMRQPKPAAPQPEMGRPLISLSRPVPAACTVSAMPSISSKSAMPAIVRALTAVPGFSRLRRISIANSVHSSPSQKNSVSPMWSDRSAPSSMAKLSQRQNWYAPPHFFPRAKPEVYSESGTNTAEENNRYSRATPSTRNQSSKPYGAKE